MYMQVCFPIRIVKSNFSTVGPSSERNRRAKCMYSITKLNFDRFLNFFTLFEWARWMCPICLECWVALLTAGRIHLPLPTVVRTLTLFISRINYKNLWNKEWNYSKALICNDLHAVIFVWHCSDLFLYLF